MMTTGIYTGSGLFTGIYTGSGLDPTALTIFYDDTWPDILIKVDHHFD